MKSPYSAYRTVLALLMAGFVSFVISGCGSSSSGSAPPATASKSCTVNDGASDNTSSTDTSGVITFTLDLDCDNSRPQAASDATGSGSITLDPNTGALSGSVTTSGLSGPITAAHIHSGLAGNTGGIIVTLEPDVTDANTMNVPSATVLDAGQIQAMRSAQYYINVHTAENASGEIRGQIVPEDYQVMLVKLEGEYETPAPVATSNSGLGFITLNTTSGDIEGVIHNTGLDDASAAHIHEGFAGANGGIRVTLVKDADPSIWRIPSSTTLNAADLSNLLAGGTYFNVHTPANGSGEVRGQIEPDDIKIRRVELDGEQEVPPVPTSASGIGYVTVNENSGDIVANVRTSGIVALDAHVHQAPAGSNGGIAIGLTQGNPDTDFWSATGTLTAGQLTAFQASELYFNVHSGAYPGGEIRAQIRR